MADAFSRQDPNDAIVLTNLDKAIEAMEKGLGSVPVRIEFADDISAEATHASELDGLLQRARGLRLVAMIAEGQSVDRPSSMRKGKPALHPEVEEILDALKRSG